LSFEIFICLKLSDGSVLQLRLDYKHIFYGATIRQRILYF
jgi:hypothetical protein